MLIQKDLHSHITNRAQTHTHTYIKNKTLTYIEENVLRLFAQMFALFKQNKTPRGKHLLLYIYISVNVTSRLYTNVFSEIHP